MNDERENIVVSLLQKSLPDALSELKKSDPSVAMSYLSGGELMVNYPWVEAKVMLQEEHGREAIDNFFQKFDKEKAKKARRTCCIGTKRSNRLTELDLLENIQRLQEIEKTTGKEDSKLAAKIGRRLSDLVKDGNEKPIGKLYEIVKNKRQFDAIDITSDSNQTEKIWKIFCMFFIEEKKLPTKKQLRETWESMLPNNQGANKSDDVKRTFTDIIKKLGLAGLQKEKRN